MCLKTAAMFVPDIPMSEDDDDFSYYYNEDEAALKKQRRKDISAALQAPATSLSDGASAGALPPRDEETFKKLRAKINAEVPDECIDLLTRLLAYEPAHRISAKQVGGVPLTFWQPCFDANSCRH